METPESIRTSLQIGEWVMSIDFKDAYFHIPINSQCRNYLHFYVQDQSYQFKSLPFGLSTVSMEFKMVVKEVKLMVQNKGISIHQYQDDWLVRATSHKMCLHHTLTLVALCQELGWKENKVGTGTQTDVRFHRLAVWPQTGQSPANPRTLGQPLGWIENKVGTGTQTDVWFHRLPVRPQTGLSPANPRALADRKA